MFFSEEAVAYLSHCNRSIWRRVPPEIVNIPEVPDSEPGDILDAIQAQAARLRAHEPFDPTEPVYIHPHVRYERRARA